MPLLDHHPGLGLLLYLALRTKHFDVFRNLCLGRLITLFILPLTLIFNTLEGDGSLACMKAGIKGLFQVFICEGLRSRGLGPLAAVYSASA